MERKFSLWGVMTFVKVERPSFITYPTTNNNNNCKKIDQIN